MNELIEVIPGQARLSQPLFSSESEFEAFRKNYTEQMKPELELLREARQQSEEESKQHWTR